MKTQLFSFKQLIAYMQLLVTYKKQESKLNEIKEDTSTIHYIFFKKFASQINIFLFHLSVESHYSSHAWSNNWWHSDSLNLLSCFEDVKVIFSIKTDFKDSINDSNQGSNLSPFWSDSWPQLTKENKKCRVHFIAVVLATCKNISVHPIQQIIIGVQQ